MDRNELAKAAKPKSLADYLSGLPQAPHPSHGPGGQIETVRQDEYEGHRIVIRTTYTIEVDAKPLQVPLALANDGSLHCHSIPNYQFNSAVDMVKRLIDAYPEDFSASHHGGHAGHGQHGHGEGGR